MRQETRRRTTREARFEVYVSAMVVALGHEDRAGPFRAYCAGLLGPSERKSVEPMAAVVEPERVSSRHQSMHHFVAQSPWEDRPVLDVAYRWAVEPLERHGPIAGWIVDDTGQPKKGKDSVGVARQYCGATGKKDNCRVAVSLSVANSAGSVPVAYRLYLPEEWANDPERRERAGVPEEIGFQPKWKIALDQIDTAIALGVPRAPVVADAGYGNITEFREGLTARKLKYAVGIDKTTTVWPPGTGPLPPLPSTGKRGRRPKRLRRTADHRPTSVLALARSLPRSRYRTVTWREGAKGKMRSRFAAVRVRPAHEDHKRVEPWPEEWLLIEWPAGEKDPTKYWLSSLGPATQLRDLVRLAKIRWRIERDYQELKDELGLDHYEGRNWRGFHHHATICIAAYAFLMAERLRFSPLRPHRVRSFLRLPPLPPNYRPRGRPARAAPPTDVHRDHPHGTRQSTRASAAVVPDVRPPPTDLGNLGDRGTAEAVKNDGRF